MSSLMNNFDIARKALETSRGSSGSAETELDKYMQSIEAKQKQLTASFQAFWEESFKIRKGVIA